MTRSFWLTVAAGALLAVAACKSGGQRSAEDIDPKSLYRVEITPPEPLRVGETQPLRIVVRPIAGGEIKEETPFRGKAEASGPIAVERTEFTYAERSGLVDGGPAFDLPVRGIEPGEGKVDVDLSFFVCVEEACLRTGEQRSVPVQVRP